MVDFVFEESSSRPMCAVNEKWYLQTAKPIGMRRWEMPAMESFARSSLINDNINRDQGGISHHLIEGQLT